MPDIEPQATVEQSAQRIEDGLREDFGALLTQADLARLLRYPTVQAVRKARARGNLAIPMFQLPMRRGWFATARAVAEFLATLEQRPLITTRQVATLLSYPSAGAVRQAYQRGTLPVPLCRQGGRRLLARLADIEKVLTERLEPSRTSTQRAMTEEEAS
jgi:hypothetical protein